MRIIEGDITKIEYGTIIHQVNCQGAWGAGVSGAIGKRWPAAEAAYRRLASECDPKSLLGTIQRVNVSDEICVINLFTQLYYGNAKRTGRVYTDMDRLIASLTEICHTPHLPLYAPYGIGCGLAGGRWSELESAVKERGLAITFVKLPTKEQKG